MRLLWRTFCSIIFSFILMPLVLVHLPHCSMYAFLVAWMFQFWHSPPRHYCWETYSGETRVSHRHLCRGSLQWGNMRIPPATCKYTHISRHVRIHDSGRGRGNLIRVFTPSKACLSPWDRGTRKSSSSVSPCVASDVHAIVYACMSVLVACTSVLVACMSDLWHSPPRHHKW